MPGTGRGGARHLPKPFIDVMLLLDALKSHKDILNNFGAYNAVSKNMAVDPKGIMHCYFLLQELIKISPTAEIHSQPLRQALLKLLTDNPELNDTKYNGQVWVSLKADRVSLILLHCRRLKVQGGWGTCAAKLTGAEYQLLQKLIDSISAKAVYEPLTERILKKQDSDISKDEDGFPNMLRTPEPTPEKKLALEDAEPEVLSKGVKRPLSKRLGQRAQESKSNQKENAGTSSGGKKKTRKTKRKETKSGEKEPLPKRPDNSHQKDKGCLKSLMGLKQSKEKPKEKKEMKKPSSAASSAGSKQKAKASPSRLPWAKLRVTRANNPERSYITGTKDPDSKKVSLVVEISKKRSERCHEIIGIIYSKLKDEKLTKEEALELREQLC